MNPIDAPGAARPAGDRPRGAVTLGGEPVAPVTLSLPKTVVSICPECRETIPAEQYVDAGRVMMRKRCPRHGEFRDIVSSDAEMHLALERWHFGDGRGYAQTAGAARGECPSRCGICAGHSAHAVMTVIDLTGRCNLSCGTCFADANRRSYELSYDQAVAILARLRARTPLPAAVQFSGGEPTIHPRFLDICRAAKEMGFAHIQVASNGLRLADPGYARAAREAGLQYIYLQMDGVTDAAFEAFRGRKLLDVKLAVIESARQAGLRITFVPTVAKGINDREIGGLFRLALENRDVLSGISFQPMSFSGRHPEADRLRMRFTLTDLAREFGEQTGLTRLREDWYPLSVPFPFVRLAEALTGGIYPNNAGHPHCGIMTLLFVDDAGRPVPVTRFLDLHALLRDVDALADRARRTRFRSLAKVRSLQLLKKHFRADEAPEGLTFTRFLRTLDGMGEKKYSWDEAYRGYTYKTFFVTGMHFMDAYNYETERVSRCCVHYSAPDGREYPFCTYNSGPVFRTRVEEDLARS